MPSDPPTWGSDKRPVVPDPARERAVRPPPVPAGLAGRIAGYAWGRDLVGESGGAVHRLHARGRPTLYLKHGTGAVAADIADEHARLRWFGEHLPVPRVECFLAEPDEAWLLTTALEGRTAHQLLTEDPDQAIPVVRAIAAFLRDLHALPADRCPFNGAHPLRLAHARRRLDRGEVDADDFGDDHTGWTPHRLWDHMIGLLPFAPDPVVTHGDWSLDNILLDGGRVAGCIDLGRAGVADRYQDLAILHDCLGEFDLALQDELWRAYGVEQPDRRKLDFHLCLDEFF